MGAPPPGREADAAACLRARCAAEMAGRALAAGVGRDLIRRNPLANVELPAIPKGETLRPIVRR